MEDPQDHHAGEPARLRRRGRAVTGSPRGRGAWRTPAPTGLRPRRESGGALGGPRVSLMPEGEGGGALPLREDV